jgi:hypothetical protein
MQHSFVVTADLTDMFIEIHLSPLPFWQRVGNALRYIFGARSKYGDFEEIMLTPHEALDLGDSLVEWATGESVAFTPNDVY